MTIGVKRPCELVSACWTMRVGARERWWLAVSFHALRFKSSGAVQRGRLDVTIATSGSDLRKERANARGRARQNSTNGDSQESGHRGKLNQVLSPAGPIGVSRTKYSSGVPSCLILRNATVCANPPYVPANIRLDPGTKPSQWLYQPRTAPPGAATTTLFSAMRQAQKRHLVGRAF